MSTRNTGAGSSKKAQDKIVINPDGPAPRARRKRAQAPRTATGSAPTRAARVPRASAGAPASDAEQVAPYAFTRHTELPDEQDPTSLPLFAATASSARRLAGSFGSSAGDVTQSSAPQQASHPGPDADAGTGEAPDGAAVDPSAQDRAPGRTGPETVNAEPQIEASRPVGVPAPAVSSNPAQVPGLAGVSAPSADGGHVVRGRGDLLSTPQPVAVPPSGGAADPRVEQDGSENIDWSLVRRVRNEVAETLSEHLDGARLVDPQVQGPVVERAVRDKLTDLERESRIAGQPLFASREELRRVAQAVFDDLFGRGRLLRLTTLPGLENLEIRGCDEVTLLFADGRIVKAAPVANSDSELIEELQYIASTAPTGEKAFSPAEPRLHMMLPDGSRLSAAAWYTARPTATIRIHRYVDVTLADMVSLNMLSSECAAFLSASVKAGKSVVVSGMPGAGKTTLIRAILNELDPDVAIATIESMFELLMHEMPERHHRVWAAESTEGAGERLPNGRHIGQVTMADALRDALRQNVDRMVVGEVLGPEVRAMIDAMKVGKGSVSTIHATSAADTVERLVSALMDPENGLVSVEHAYREVATHIDLIVYVDVIDETEIGGRKNRFVAQVYGIERSEDARYATVPLWDLGPDRRASAQGIAPTWVDDLLPYGITEHTLRGATVDTWQAPLKTLRDYSTKRRAS